MDVFLWIEARLSAQFFRLEVAERLVERLVVVRTVPIEIERIVRRELRVRRQFHMQHQAARAQYAMGLAHDVRDALLGNLVQEHRGKHHVETRVRKIERLGIHLREVDRPALRFGTRVGITQTRRGDVDAVHFGIGELVLPRARVVADGAAEIENFLWLEIRIFETNEAGDRLSDVIEVLTHQTKREHRETVVVKCTRGKIVGLVLAIVVAGHEVHVDRRHVARHLESGLQRQRSALATLALRQGRGFALERVSIALQRWKYRLPNHVLRGDAQTGIELEVLVGLDRLVNFRAVFRGAAGTAPKAWLHAALVNGTHAGGHVVEHVRTQAGNEIHSRFFVARLGQFQFVLEFEHGVLSKMTTLLQRQPKNISPRNPTTVCRIRSCDRRCHWRARHASRWPC